MPQLDKLTEIHTDVKWIKDAIEQSTERMDKHDERIAKLERWRTWLAGAAAVIAGLFGAGHLPK
jgi:ribosomal 50S subunit-associated protein YjgA (DUF615 family)